MNFSAQLDTLQQHVSDAKSAAESAATESNDKLKQRIDQAQLEMNLAVKDAKQHAGEATASARSKWAQMKADTAARMNEVQTRMNKRGDQIDARVAVVDAEWAESDAEDALDYAVWAIDNARLSVLTAINARVYADERAEIARA